MAIVPINLTDEQLFALYEVADTDYNGNVSEAIRSVLANQYPAFAKAKQPLPLPPCPATVTKSSGPKPICFPLCEHFGGVCSARLDSNRR